MPDLSEVIQYLNAVSAVAVLLGVVFVVFQLKQNARVIRASNEMAEAASKQVEASLQQNKSNVAFSIVERFTDDSFALRRKTVRDIIRKYSANDWQGFLETGDDFEVRAFGSYHEYTAYLAKAKIIDAEMLQDVLGHRITFDWDAFAPAAEYYRKTEGLSYIFTNFEWLAKTTKEYLDKKEQELASR